MSHLLYRTALDSREINLEEDEGAENLTRKPIEKPKENSAM
jgi:hypothetical protein